MRNFSKFKSTLINFPKFQLNHLKNSVSSREWVWNRCLIQNLKILKISQKYFMIASEKKVKQILYKNVSMTSSSHVFLIILCFFVGGIILLHSIDSFHKISLYFVVKVKLKFHKAIFRHFTTAENFNSNTPKTLK